MRASAPDFTVEVRDRDFVRLGQVAPEYLDLMFVDAFNSVGAWEMKLPAEHRLLPALRQKGAGIIVTEHWTTVDGQHHYRIYSGRMRSARLSQNAADPAGTWIISGAHDNIVAAATLVYPDPANAPDAQTVSHWTTAGDGETVMKQAVYLNAGAGALAPRKYPWLTVAANLNRGASVKTSSRFDTLGDLLTSLGTAAGLGWRFAQQGATVAFDVFTPADKTKTVRLDIRNGGIQSNELGFTAPSATKVLVMGQGEGEDRTILQVSSTDAAAEAAAWGLNWEVTKDQRQTDDPAELLQAGTELILEQGSTVNSLKVTPSDAPNMRLGVDWYIGDRITAVVDGQETTALVTQVATSITSAGVIRQATVGDPVGFDFEARVASKVNDHEKRIGQVERLVGQGVDWVNIANRPARLEPAGQATTNWDTTRDVGFYYSAAGATGAPFTGQAFMGRVIAGAGGWREQRLTLLSQAVTTEWYRVYNGSTWGPWRRSDRLVIPASVTNGTFDPITGRTNLTAGTRTWSFDGVFTSEFRKYRIEYQWYTADSQGAWLRLRNGGTDKATADYHHHGIYASGTGAVSASSQAGVTTIGFPYMNANGHAGHIIVSEPMYTAGNMNQKRFEWHDFHTSNPQGNTIGGGQLNNNDVNSFDGFTISLSNMSVPGLPAGAHAWISITAIA